MPHKLEELFKPKSIAFVGASVNPLKWGHIMMRIALEEGYEGNVYPINPKGEEILNLPSFPRVEDVPVTVDVAVIITPTTTVPDCIRDCARKGARFAVIHTAGFGEVNDEGAAIEREMVDIARKAGMRIVGPNCMNLFSAASKLNLTGTERFPAGNIAFISQSGNLGVTFAHEAWQKNIGFSHYISVGNQADIGIHEYLEYFGQDSDTKAIVVYMEGLNSNEGKAFIDTARVISPLKPVVVLKGGNTSAGARSASSHTGSLAGTKRVYEAAFRQAGIIQVHNSDELLSIAETLVKCPIPGGNSISVVGGGGGHATLMSDAAEKNGMIVPEFSLATKRKLAKLLPERAAYRNPIDFTGASEEDLHVYGKCCEITLLEEGITGSLIYGFFGGWRQDLLEGTNTYEYAAQQIIELPGKYGKPIVMHTIFANDRLPCIDILRRGGIPVFESVEIAARCMGALCEYGEIQRRFAARLPYAQPKTSTSCIPRDLVEKAMQRPHHSLTENEVMGFLRSRRFPTPPFEVVKTPDEAVQAADKIGYPVVLKVLSPDILHKSDWGGVAINLASGVEVSEAFASIVHKVMERVEETRISGMLIYPYLTGGTEVIIGVTRDSQFGPVLMFGLGGVFVELFADVSFRVAPIDEHDAMDMIGETKAYQMLKGIRGSMKKDIHSLISVLLQISDLVVSCPEIAEIDLNPTLVFNEGATVVDARVIIRNPENGRSR